MLWVVAGLVLVGMMVWVAMLVTRLEITDSVVRARQGRAKKQVARSEICSIHYFPGVISFRGADRTQVLRTPANWSIRQMLEVADELAVPLYDHRDPRWLGLREVKTGRLVHRPAPDQPVR